MITFDRNTQPELAFFSRVLVGIDLLRMLCSAHRAHPLNMCSNDYLGMGQHSAVLTAIEEMLRAGGAGGAATSLETAMCILPLKQELADLHGREAALNNRTPDRRL